LTVLSLMLLVIICAFIAFDAAIDLILLHVKVLSLRLSAAQPTFDLTLRSRSGRRAAFMVRVLFQDSGRF
jgi:hypothetical protein